MGETESALLHEAVPPWVSDVVIDRAIPRFIKIPFYLLPHPQMAKQERMKKVRNFGILFCKISIFNFRLQDRLIANEFIQCRKVCEHVLEKILGAEITPSGTAAANSGNSNSQNNSQSDANSEGSQIPAEDKIELLCNDVVCDPNMDLRTVKHFIWKQSTDLTFHYKTKPNFS